MEDEAKSGLVPTAVVVVVVIVVVSGAGDGENEPVNAMSQHTSKPSFSHA
jgi:hypothetical protein